MNLRDIPKHYRKDIEAAIKRGWSVHMGGGNHLIFRWKGGGEQLSASLTPSDSRGYKNHMSRMQRIEREYPCQ